MSKVAVVYWSGTGNTEAMADAVAEGAREKGAEVSVFTASDFSSGKVPEFDAIAFGCPAMGDEVLEDRSFRFLWLGRRPVDERLGREVPQCRCGARRGQRDGE